MPHIFVFKLTITHLNFVKQISRFLFMACTSRSKPKPLHTLTHTLIFCITWKLAEKWQQYMNLFVSTGVEKQLNVLKR